MGCGKTTLGQYLAHTLKYGFIDMDKTIEIQQQKTIPEIFNEKGETHFRDLERELLKSTTLLNNTIVSTGGGTPCFFDGLDIMNTHGKTVYLHTKPKVLCERLLKAQDERPLLNNLKTKEELYNFISKKLLQRQQIYQQANYQININYKSTLKNTCNSIIKKLNLL